MYQLNVKPKDMTLHKTASDTYRILVDGEVNPHLVGFHNPCEAVAKAIKLYPKCPVTIPRHLSDFFSEAVQLMGKPKDVEGKEVDIVVL